MQINKIDIQIFGKGIINSYGQIFFSTKYWFSILLLLVSFFDPLAGLVGLISVATANSVALLFAYNRLNILSGLYGYNALLVGLGLGIYFNFSIALFFIVIISAILTLFISIMMEGILYKYGLPFLSLPFLLVIWTLNLAVNDFTALGLSARGMYTLNMLYANGGESLVNAYQWWGNLVNHNILTTYFISLGAIFFQYNVLAGMLIAIGLLIFSRIAFSLSLIGYFAAYFFYLLIGSDISNVSYMYIGFNYILTAIAVGGFFIIPSKSSYFWTLLLIPLVAILTISLNKVFTVFGISMYALPFNMIVLMFVYVLKFRIKTKTDLNPVLTQEFSPEKNLYSYNNYKNRLAAWFENLPIQLPFFGAWTISQAHNGDITHQGDWRHAWDFIIESEEGEQYKNAGDRVDDYYCYGKAVLAVADGIVEEIVDGIEDNKIGEVNLDQNWGNTIVIRHSAVLFSKLSHLKAGSFKVSKGEYVKSGQTLASCGNTGRSPFPHLHFQMQATPFIGSKTIEYPISSYFLKSKKGLEHKQFSIPQKDNIVSRPIPEKQLQNAFNFVAGKTIKWKVEGADDLLQWDVKISALNQKYLECRQSKSKAFFSYHEQQFYFTGFSGDKSSYLFKFYLSAQNIQMSFFEGMQFSENVRPNDVYNGVQMFFQDFVASFYLWLKPYYLVNYSSSRSGFTKQNIILESQVLRRNNKKVQTSKILIGDKGLEEIVFDNKQKLKIEYQR